MIFRESPLVVITVPERSPGDKYADVTAATRLLIDKFKLRVMVDGSLNSIPLILLTTRQQEVSLC